MCHNEQSASLLSRLELSHVPKYAPSFSLSAPCILLTLTHRLRFISNPYFDTPSSHCKPYILTNGTEPVYLIEPTRNIFVNPTHGCRHFPMDFLHPVQIPANGFIVKYAITEGSDCVQRSRDILPLSVFLGHKRERPAQVLPQQTLIFAV